MKFIDAHRHIGFNVQWHASDAILRLPPPWTRASSTRATDVVHLGDFYAQDTGRPVRPSAHSTARRYGTLAQWE